MKTAIHIKPILGKRSGDGAVRKALQATGSKGILLRLRAKNVSAGTIYLQLHDAETAPANGAVPDCPSVPLAPGAYYESTTPFTGENGIYICASSTEFVKTLVAADDVTISAEVA